MKSVVGLCFLLAVGAGSYVALASDSGSHEILITRAVAQPTKTGTLAFMTIANTGTPDTLIGVTSPMADVSFYMPAAQDSLPVPTDEVSLALDAAHIQIDQTGLKHGELVPMSLEFARAGKIAAKVRVWDPVETGEAEEVGLFGMGDICIVGDGEPAPAISLAVSETPNGYSVQILTEEFTFSEDLDGLYHVPGVGHGHIYVGGMKLGRLYSTQSDIGALPKGEHEVRVTLNTNDHRAYVVDDVPVTATALIVVD